MFKLALDTLILIVRLNDADCILGKSGQIANRMTIAKYRITEYWNLLVIAAATKVFIGELPTTRGAWVIIG